MVSWSQIVEFGSMFTEADGSSSDGPGEGSNDDIATHRVNGLLPVIVWGTGAPRRADALGLSASEGLAPAAADPRAL